MLPGFSKILAFLIVDVVDYRAADRICDSSQCLLSWRHLSQPLLKSCTTGPRTNKAQGDTNCVSSVRCYTKIIYCHCRCRRIFKDSTTFDTSYLHSCGICSDVSALPSSAGVGAVLRANKMASPETLTGYYGKTCGLTLPTSSERVHIDGPDPPPSPTSQHGGLSKPPDMSTFLNVEDRVGVIDLDAVDHLDSSILHREHWIGPSLHINTKIEVSEEMERAKVVIPISRRTGLPTRKYVRKSIASTSVPSSSSQNGSKCVGATFVRQITALVDKIAEDARLNICHDMYGVPFVPTGIQPCPAAESTTPKVVAPKSRHALPNSSSCFVLEPKHRAHGVGVDVMAHSGPSRRDSRPLSDILLNDAAELQGILTSTVDMKDETRGRPIQKAKVEIILEKSKHFNELMAATREEQELAPEDDHVEH